MRIIKAAMVIIGVAAVMMGSLWMLQGLDIVRWPASSFMLGDIVWTRNGAVLALVGAAMIFVGRR